MIDFNDASHWIDSYLRIDTIFNMFSARHLLKYYFRQHLFQMVHEQHSHFIRCRKKTFRIVGMSTKWSKIEMIQLHRLYVVAKCRANKIFWTFVGSATTMRQILGRCCIGERVDALYFSCSTHFRLFHSCHLLLHIFWKIFSLSTIIFHI